MPDEQLKQKALDWINGIRQQYGLEALTEIPKGQPGRAEDCALAKAAQGMNDRQRCYGAPAYSPERDLSVGPAEPVRLRFGRGGRVIEHEVPAEVTEFLRRFDRGEFPELITE